MFLQLFLSWPKKAEEFCKTSIFQEDSDHFDIERHVLMTRLKVHPNNWFFRKQARKVFRPLSAMYLGNRIFSKSEEFFKKLLRIFLVFFKNFLGFLFYGIFFEEFFGWNFLEEFFGRNSLGGILWEEYYGRDSDIVKVS